MIARLSWACWGSARPSGRTAGVGADRGWANARSGTERASIRGSDHHDEVIEELREVAKGQLGGTGRASDGDDPQGPGAGGCGGDRVLLIGLHTRPQDNDVRRGRWVGPGLPGAGPRSPRPGSAGWQSSRPGTPAESDALA